VSSLDAYLHDCSKGEALFCKLHPEPCFLFLSSDAPGESVTPPMSFGTVAVNVKLAIQSPGYESTREYRAIPLKKDPSNPWKDRVSLGRARNNDLMIRATSISKLHAHCILGESGQVSLIDLGSTNGTLKNGKRLAPNEAQSLADGDRVRFGSVDTVFYLPPSLFHVLNKMLRGANTTPPRKGERQSPPE
jgi:hypothetical protein